MNFKLSTCMKQKLKWWCRQVSYYKNMNNTLNGPHLKDNYTSKCILWTLPQPRRTRNKKINKVIWKTKFAFPLQEAAILLWRKICNDVNSVSQFLTRLTQARWYCVVCLSLSCVCVRTSEKKNGGHFQRRADFLFRFLHVHDGYNHHGIYPFAFYHSQSVISCVKGKISAKIKWVALA